MVSGLFTQDAWSDADQFISAEIGFLLIWQKANGCHFRGAQQLTGNEGSYLPNCQTNLVIVLHAMSLLFKYFIKKTWADTSLQLRLLKRSMPHSTAETVSCVNMPVKAWSSLVEWDVGCISPSAKLLCVWQIKKVYAALVWHHSIHVWRLGSSSCSSPPTKELHG